MLNVGATHGDESRRGLHLRERDRAILPSLFQHAWVAFAEDPVGGLSALDWPTYTADGKVSGQTSTRPEQQAAEGSES